MQAVDAFIASFKTTEGWRQAVDRFGEFDRRGIFPNALRAMKKISTGQPLILKRGSKDLLRSLLTDYVRPH